MTKKRNTTKRLPKKKLEELKEDIRKGAGITFIANKYGVSLSTVSYHKDQMRKSDKLDADIEEQERLKDRTVTIPTMRHIIADKTNQEEEMKSETHKLKNRIQALELEVARGVNKIEQLQELVCEYALREYKLI